jgi:hypothetical protein
MIEAEKISNHEIDSMHEMRPISQGAPSIERPRS